MPYRKINELPSSVSSNLPIHGQEIYKEAFKSAWDQYKNPEKRKKNVSREEVAHKVAWSAVKNSYRKNSKGDWVRI